MGNKSGKPKPAPTNTHTVPNTTADESSDDEDKRESVLKHVNEAEVFIKLMIFHELPQGSTLDYVVTVNPMKKVIDIKKDLSYIVNIPPENIQIYRHQRPQTAMPNNSTLHELLTQDESQLRVRDSRITYSKPITVQ